MFEKIGRLAERAATGVSVSRRGFLGRLGQSALGVAGVLAGVSAATAQSGGVVCCRVHCGSIYKKGGKALYHFTRCYPAGWTCPAISPDWCVLLKQTTAASCSGC
jgi:hypothetical protein